MLRRIEEYPIPAVPYSERERARAVALKRDKIRVCWKNMMTAVERFRSGR
jgi:hypothetical protein